MFMLKKSPKLASSPVDGGRGVCQPLQTGRDCKSFPIYHFSYIYHFLWYITIFARVRIMSKNLLSLTLFIQSAAYRPINIHKFIYFITWKNNVEYFHFIHFYLKLHLKNILFNICFEKKKVFVKNVYTLHFFKKNLFLHFYVSDKFDICFPILLPKLYDLRRKKILYLFIQRIFNFSIFIC